VAEIAPCAQAHLAFLFLGGSRKDKAVSIEIQNTLGEKNEELLTRRKYVLLLWIL
jgi:hypothetical protein